MGLDNNVADVDAHAESNAAVLDLIDCEFFDAGLKLHSGSNGFDCTSKLRQEPVPGVLHDAATVFRDCGLDTIR